MEALQVSHIYICQTNEIWVASFSNSFKTVKVFSLIGTMCIDFVMMFNL